MNAEIIPAIMPDSIEVLRAKVATIKEAASLVQVDIADGNFVPTRTWPYIGDAGEFSEITAEREGLPFWQEVDYEIDLLVQNPETVIEEWVRAGASSIVIHVESSKNIDEAIDRLIGRGIKIGLSLNPSTDNSVLAPFVDKIDFVQCMGSDTIGQQGVALNEKVYGKISDLRALYPRLAISIDIGVHLDTIGHLYRSGATRFIAGSAVFKSDDPIEAVKELEHAVFEEQ